MTEKIKKFIDEYCDHLEKDPENKEKYYNELKEFTIEIVCKLFNNKFSKTKKDYENVQNFAKFLYESDLTKKDRTLAANYLALCNLISLYKNQMKELGIV